MQNNAYVSPSATIGMILFIYLTMLCISFASYPSYPFSFTLRCVRERAVTSRCYFAQRGLRDRDSRNKIVIWTRVDARLQLCFQSEQELNQRLLSTNARGPGKPEVVPQDLCASERATTTLSFSLPHTLFLSCSFFCSIFHAHERQ